MLAFALLNFFEYLYQDVFLLLLKMYHLFHVHVYYFGMIYLR